MDAIRRRHQQRGFNLYADQALLDAMHIPQAVAIGAAAAHPGETVNHIKRLVKIGRCIEDIRLSSLK